MQPQQKPNKQGNVKVIFILPQGVDDFLRLKSATERVTKSEIVLKAIRKIKGCPKDA